MKIENWTSGLVKHTSPSGPKYPADGWQDVKNALPVGSEIRFRNGMSEFYSGTGIPAAKTTLRSRLVFDAGDSDYIFEHWSDTLYYFKKDGTVASLITSNIDANSAMVQTGPLHIMLFTDGEDASGHPYNFLITYDPDGDSFSSRRAGMPDFAGAYLDDITIAATNLASGSVKSGKYRYMFTFSRYDGDDRLTEGGGYNEMNLEDNTVFSKEFDLNEDDSDILLTFAGSLLTAALNKSWVTHIDVYRSVNLEHPSMPDDLKYNDPWRESALWPWYRWVGKVAIAATSYTLTDNTADEDLILITDTYDTRAWKPLPRGEYAAVSQIGRIFVKSTESDVPEGRWVFNLPATSSNKNVTKYMEHYPAGLSWWYDVGRDGKQKNYGAIITPSGDLAVLQDSRIFVCYQADPTRVEIVEGKETVGNDFKRKDNSHGCLNQWCAIEGPDKRMWILGQHGFKPMDSEYTWGYDVLAHLDLAHLEKATNIAKMNAVYYPGSRHKNADGKNGYDQIILSYPSTDGGNADKCLVVLFKPEGGIAITKYEGFQMAAAYVLPSTGELVIMDETDRRHYILDDGTSTVDRQDDASNESVIEKEFQLKDFTNPDPDYMLRLHDVVLTGRNIDQEIELAPVFDGVERLSRQRFTPNVDSRRFRSPEPSRKQTYREIWGGKAFGKTISLIVRTRSRKAPIIESIALNFLKGPRI